MAGAPAARCRAAPRGRVRGPSSPSSPRPAPPPHVGACGDPSPRPATLVGKVFGCAGQEAVHAEDPAAARCQRLAPMRTDEARAPGDEDARAAAEGSTHLVHARAARLEERLEAPPRIADRGDAAGGRLEQLHARRPAGAVHVGANDVEREAGVPPPGRSCPGSLRSAQMDRAQRRGWADRDRALQRAPPPACFALSAPLP